MDDSEINIRKVKTYSDYRYWTTARGILTGVHFDLTYDCNVRCIHCYVNKEKSDKLLTTDEIKSIIDDLAKFKVVDLQFSGGEIFLRKDILEILDYAAKKRFVLRLKTNGTLITPSIAKRLSKNKFIRRIDISLLGGKAKTHDAITQVPGSYRKTLEGIKNLRHYLPRNKINIAFVPLKENYKEVLIAKRMIKKYDVEFQGGSLSITCSWVGAGTNPALHRLSAEEKYNYIKSMYKPSDFSMKNKNPSHYTCSVGQNSICIDPFGYTHPCVDFISINWGYLPKMGIKNIWENRKLKGFKIKYFSKCVKCSLLRYCHLCPALNLLENKSLFKPSKESCSLGRAVKMFSEKVQK